jgi:hypothetical protein
MIWVARHLVMLVRALNDAITAGLNMKCFNHCVVDTLEEQRYARFDGLNLTFEKAYLNIVPSKC